jgi:hypothetical protein
VIVLSAERREATPRPLVGASKVQKTNQPANSRTRIPPLSGLSSGVLMSAAPALDDYIADLPRAQAEET